MYSKVLSSCSLYIYLIHVFMMYKVELLILGIEADNVYWRFLAFLHILHVSLCS